MICLRVSGLLLLAAALAGCPKKDDGGGAPAVNRCAADLSALTLPTAEAGGSSALVIDNEAQLIGGQWAHGELGDTLLRNDKIRVVIQRPSRHIGPNPYGGNLIDADLVRGEGEAGHDQFGKMALLYAFGRTMIARHVEILRDGSEGGSAVVAVTGDDAVNDFLNVQNMIGRLLGTSTRFVIDPEAPVPARLTTYYVLNPGESRVRMLSAFCNDSDAKITAPVGDLVDRGGSVEFFNPGSCDGAMGGSSSCFVESSPWFGWQGEAAAYAIQNYRHDDASKPDVASAVLTVAGISASMVQGEGLTGMLSWLDAQATRRPGNFTIPAGGQKTFLRDFFVARDLAEIAGALAANAGATQPVVVQVVDAAGAAVVGARVAFIGADGKLLSVGTTDEQGGTRTIVADASAISAQAELPGHAVSELRPLSACPASGCVIALGEARTLTISVKDPFNAPSPAKVTVLCPATGGCVFPTGKRKRFHDHEVLPDNVAAIGFVPPQGALELKLPPGQYEVVVTRGPEYNAWPDTWPTAGAAVDLTSGPVAVNAVLARVIDTTGWLSADLHVHSVNSPDSALRNELRVLSFAAEGVDLLCSTDHDYITDFAPFVRSTGTGGVLATMIGLEVTPFDWGHYNTFPITTTATANGGAFDWAGGEGATLRQSQLFDGLKAIWPGAIIQMNHPRGPIGALTLLRVDTATLASHSPAAAFRQDPSPTATANDTGLFTDRWDTIEIINGGRVEYAQRVLNDWFTFLSRGSVRTGTATSDTHYALATQSGYPRTFVEVPNDEVTGFDSSVFASSLKAHRAVGTNGPFLKVSARKLVSGVAVGEAVRIGETLSIAAGEQVELTVDIQAPEWMGFDTLEVFTHAPGREAWDGVENNSWPAERVHQTRLLSLSTSALEPVVINGQTFRRHHRTETFTLTPTVDSWFVVTLRSASAGGSLFPMHFQGVTCSGGSCTADEAKPFAFSNPVFVDADGSGKYDRYPLTVTPPPPPPLPQPIARELKDAALRSALRDLARSH